MKPRIPQIITSVVFSIIFRSCRAFPLLNPFGDIPGLSDIEFPRQEDEVLIFRLFISVVLVLLGGVFAGLTIGLMGQDQVYLQVVAESGEAHERKNAARVLRLLSNGKHWVLVTLLLANVITNETLPIVLDRALGGGWPAVISSTISIVIFGEIIPQSICVRYGLALGAFFAPFVQLLMYLLYPLAYPISLVLDWALGECDHGTVYKKAGLKSLVTLHHTMGVERLNEDEVTIISAVLDLKDKPIGSIMTPMDDVFVLSADTVLDQDMVEKILLTGFNRIPIHAPEQPLNFIGMLLVRILITYDPEDCLPISSFALATLPETHPDTSCLNILNYFQEGKSHMVTVSTKPGAMTGAIGVVTLEDVIEELIGEEIVDESDVFVNVHKAIRRQTPSPLLKTHPAYKGLTAASQSALTKLLPSNRASNPKSTHNSKIAIKRTFDQASPAAVDETLEFPRSKPKRPSFNAQDTVNLAGEDSSLIMASESAAIDVNLRTNVDPNLHSIPQPELEEHETSVNHDNASQEQQETLAEGGLRGGFIENVVNVDGFNKIVIADISPEDSSANSVKSVKSVRSSRSYTA